MIFTDAVSEAEKSALIRHATVMVNPSRMESLSLLLLEALSNGIPMLVNGKCRVMKDHCKSSGAAFWYDSSRDFRNKLHRLISDPELRRTMGEKGPVYVHEHYDWSVIIPKLQKLIESL
ncbi:MAG: glycosyltransferase [Alistipes senegalensis]